MNFWVGTSGFSYKEWKGSFYPEDLPNNEMLRYYSERLKAVEINNTFYRMPKAEMLEGWTEQVPQSFRFVLKASRKITHFKKLKGAEEETEYLFKTADVLGDRLGLILFQLPPYLRKDAELLGKFVEWLPKDKRAAFEFRHHSWFDDEIFKLLEKQGCALCLADTESDEETRVVSTAGWGYLRLRRPGYDETALKKWLNQIASQDWKEVFVFFKHEDEGTGPKLAQQFYQLATTGK